MSLHQKINWKNTKIKEKMAASFYAPDAFIFHINIKMR